MPIIYTENDEAIIAERIRNKLPGETDADIGRELGIHERKVQYIRREVIEPERQQARNRVACMPWV